MDFCRSREGEIQKMLEKVKAADSGNTKCDMCGARVDQLEGPRVVLDFEIDTAKRCILPSGVHVSLRPPAVVGGWHPSSNTCLCLFVCLCVLVATVRLRAVNFAE